MKPDETTIRRLAFIKYLYRVAVQESKGPEPLSSVSLLLFHDAIELFLQFASEYLGVSKQQISFMEYWDLLSQEPLNVELTQKESMRRLNKARVALKHHGTLPSKLDIEAFRASATNFFEENVPSVFNVGFSDISLIDLVRCTDTKNNLAKAERLLKENRIEDALDKVALAFAQLVDDYEDRKKGRYGRSPFFFGESLTFLDSYHVVGRDSSGLLRRLADFVDKVKESVEAVRDAVKILSLAIDYRRYVRFRLLTPDVAMIIGGGYHILRGPRGSKGIPTAEEVRFCIDFVIDSAIVLQEFDFSVDQH